MTIKEQIRFIDAELQRIIKGYEITTQTLALSLYDAEELFVGQFIKVNNEGEVIIGFPRKKGIPRRGDILLSFLLPQELCDLKNWEGYTYRKLFENALVFSELQCVWQGKGKNPNVMLCGLRRMTIEFFERLTPGCLIVLGPNEPPIRYYENLKYYLAEHGRDDDNILSLELSENNWEPVEIKNDIQRPQFLLNQLQLEDIVVIQGPPGTGKTTLISRICKEILKDSSNTVLVTSLANRALMEVAKHDELKEFLDNEAVYKTNLTVDEKKEAKGIQRLEDVMPIESSISLSTFYSTSDKLRELGAFPKFDFLIIDEASQALLPTFGAFQALARKCIWVGDQMQLPPVINLNADEVRRLNALDCVEGFKNVCYNNQFPGFLLNETYRFGQRAANFTGTFYKDKLKSVKKGPPLSLAKLPKEEQSFFNQAEGPSLVKLDLPAGDQRPKAAFEFIRKLVGSMRNHYKYDIAVLTSFKRTVKALQKELSDFLDEKTAVETIDRVQGKNTDICIFLICNDGYSFSLSPNRFNVATSRARYHTLIVADESITGRIYSQSVNSFFDKFNH